MLRPDRQQLQWLPRNLDEVLAQDHAARAIWGLLEKMDLSAFYGSIKATVERPGRPTTDPQVLLALWLLGTVVEGVGSARRLARLCQEHDAYRWLCGGVPINYHMLSDFRVAQDGMRVRASAGASSFRRQETLEKHLKEARAQVARLAKEREHPDPGVSQREQRARERVEQALDLLPQAQATKEGQERTLATPKRDQVTQPRVSTTDPQARVVKMPDGGFRPAYNVELATDRAKGIIVGVSVIREVYGCGPSPAYGGAGGKANGSASPGLSDGRRFCHEERHHRPGGTERHSVLPSAAASEQTGGGGLPAPLRRYTPSSAVASAYGHGGSQGRIPRARLHRRMGQCPGEPAWGVPIHRPGAGQGHLGNAFGGSGS